MRKDRERSENCHNIGTALEDDIDKALYIL